MAVQCRVCAKGMVSCPQGTSKCSHGLATCKPAFSSKCSHGLATCKPAFSRFLGYGDSWIVQRNCQWWGKYSHLLVLLAVVSSRYFINTILILTPGLQSQEGNRSPDLKLSKYGTSHYYNRKISLKKNCIIGISPNLFCPSYKEVIKVVISRVIIP